MRQDVQKFLFIGSEIDKERFFQRAQEEGVIQFIDASPSKKELPEDIQKTISSIKVLRSLPVVDQEENFERLDADTMIASILDLELKKESLTESIAHIEEEISRIRVLGYFSFQEIAEIEEKTHCKCRFFIAPSSMHAEEDTLPDGLIELGSENGFHYYLAISLNGVCYKNMEELKFDRSLASLEKSLVEEKENLQSIEYQLKEQAKYSRYLHHVLIDKLNAYHLSAAQLSVKELLNASLFMVEGWVPHNKVHLLNSITSSLAVYSEQVAIEPESIVPTYLENEGQARLGEDLVHIYDTPSSQDKDPSLWVLYGFALFFAFIIGDAGYGLIYLMIALVLRYKFPHLVGASARFLNLFTFLGIACIVWGTLMTSFFGMGISFDNPLRQVSLVQWLAEKKAAFHIEHQDAVFHAWLAKYPDLSALRDVHEFVSYAPKESGGKLIILNKLTDNVMFELALFIGVVHLILSLLRYSGRNWQNIGWVLFLVGAYCFLPSYLNTPSFLNFVGGMSIPFGKVLGIDLMIGGIVLAWLLAIFRYGWLGIFEVMTLIQVFADTLSYLRLYALGLAGAIVGSTINEIASGMRVGFAILLVVLAHGVNIVLSTMSGVIHGLRLNFLEWYHYSFEGGGKNFTPLQRLEKESNKGNTNGH